MTLQQLMREVPGQKEMQGDASLQIAQLVSDSRKESKDGLFFCFKGERFDSHDYAQQAIDNGCVALVVERLLPLPVSQLLVPNARLAMAYIAPAFYGFPSRHMKMVGVTGTKGKTTTSFLVKSICEQAGYKCGLIGTTGHMIGQQKLPGTLTTPDPIELHETLRQMLDAGVEVVSMEVSAHALAQYRTDGILFEAVAYTNLSQDHLDFFHTMEVYLDAKKRLFDKQFAKNAAFNADEETSAYLMEELEIPSITYGIRENSDVFARDIEISETGVSFQMHLRSVQSVPVELALTGMFNVYNAMAAAALALILGVELPVVKQGLEALRSVPGRVEMLDTQTPFHMYLDYSHSPDALDNILRTMRTFTKGKLIAVFGCGGDRDKGKRPIMGKIGGELADFCVLTSDNPRRENPFDILSEIEKGILPTGGAYVVIENRREAILHAMRMAQAGDVIVLAGKGHETYQEINGIKYPFDEKVVVQELLVEEGIRA